MATSRMTQAPPPPPVPRTGPSASAGANKFSIGAAPGGFGQRVVLYGPSGIGKTTLASLAPGAAFVDLDESIAQLGLSAPVVAGIDSWADLRSALAAPLWTKVRTIVLDTGTKAEDLAIAHTLATVRTERGGLAGGIEDYGYGKGYQYVYDTFLPLLGDLDQHVRAGRNVILICHDCTAKEPNPAGEDYLCYQPRLMAPGQEKKNSIRHRVREWADHVLFLAYDIYAKDGKASGSGSRTIFPQAPGYAWAKSRTLRDSLEYIEGDAALWNLLGMK